MKEEKIGSFNDRFQLKEAKVTRKEKHNKIERTQKHINRRRKLQQNELK